MTATPATGQAAASMHRVTHYFDGLRALDDLSLEVAPGQLLGVIGPSGAGKTTAIRILTGGFVATSGLVRTLGEVPGRLQGRTRERIGFMLFGMGATLFALCAWLLHRSRAATR